MPTLVVDSPTQHARSPPRSPRTASLLLALRDVIGPDTTDHQENTWNDALPTLVNQHDFENYSHPEEEPEEQEVDLDADHSWTAISDYGDDDDDQEAENQEEDNDEDDDDVTMRRAVPIEDDRVSEGSGLLSPIELSTLHLGPFRHEPQPVPLDTIHNWQPPVPMVSSPPRSPSTSSTLDILASPFRNYATSILSPRHSTFGFVSRSVTATPTPTGGSPVVQRGVALSSENALDLGLDSPSDRPFPLPSSSLLIEPVPPAAKEASFATVPTSPPQDQYPPLTAPITNPSAVANHQDNDGTLSLTDIDGTFDTSTDEEFWEGNEKGEGESSILDVNDEATAVYAHPGGHKPLKDADSEELVDSLKATGDGEGEHDDGDDSRTREIAKTIHHHGQHDEPNTDFGPSASPTSTPDRDPSPDLPQSNEEDTTTLAYLRSPSSDASPDRSASSIHIQAILSPPLSSSASAFDSSLNLSDAFSPAPPSPSSFPFPPPLSQRALSHLNPNLDLAHLAHMNTEAYPPSIRALLSMQENNDTIGSLYEVYSGIAPMRDVIADSMRNAGLSPPAGGLLDVDDEEEEEEEEEESDKGGEGSEEEVEEDKEQEVKKEDEEDINLDLDLSMSSPTERLAKLPGAEEPTPPTSSDSSSTSSSADSSSASFSSIQTHTSTSASDAVPATAASITNVNENTNGATRTQDTVVNRARSSSVASAASASSSISQTRSTKVFTPPPHLSQSSAPRSSVVGSLKSRPVSPALSLKAGSSVSGRSSLSGRASPFSPPGLGAAAGSASGSANAGETGSTNGSGEVQSRVVPFGFRSSFASLSSTSSSTSSTSSAAAAPASSLLLSKRGQPVLTRLNTSHLHHSSSSSIATSDGGPSTGTLTAPVTAGLGSSSAMTPGLPPPMSAPSMSSVHSRDGSLASQPMSAPTSVKRGLRPLRLSAMLNSASPSTSAFSQPQPQSRSQSQSPASSNPLQHHDNRSSSHHTSNHQHHHRGSVSSPATSVPSPSSSHRSQSLSNNALLSSARSSLAMLPSNPLLFGSPSASSTPPRQSPLPSTTSISAVRRHISSSSSGSASGSLTGSPSTSLYSTRRRLANLQRQAELEMEMGMEQGPRSAPLSSIGRLPPWQQRDLNGYRRPSSRLSERSVLEEEDNEDEGDEDDFTASTRLSSRHSLLGPSGRLERHDLVDETIRQPLVQTAPAVQNGMGPKLALSVSSLSLSTASSSSREDDRDERLKPGLQSAPTTLAVSSSSPHSLSLSNTRPLSTAGSRSRSHSHSHQPQKPNLMFALASDDPSQVLRALSGPSPRADANEMLEMGDGSGRMIHPLEFVLGNERLVNKLEMVKVLLAFGADVGVLRRREGKMEDEEIGDTGKEDGDGEKLEGVQEGKRDTRMSVDGKNGKDLIDSVDPATRYFLSRAESQPKNPLALTSTSSTHPKTSTTTAASSADSFFGPLSRVRYEVVGQDRALEQMFRVLSMQSSSKSSSPIVMLLCGPSGHGKSLLARKFGSLLDVPTHTVNMTTLRSTHDLWASYSINPYSTDSSATNTSGTGTPLPNTTSSPDTLAEFLINNEGKRCVVVLDEIEKTENEKTLWSLLMPWELGRCTLEATSRHVDVRNVIWLGTSNVGCDLVLEYDVKRRIMASASANGVGKGASETMTREEYVKLMKMLRPKVSEKLGPSVLSRVTTVLPFVPFTAEEKRAICYEALHTLGGEAARNLSPEDVEELISAAMDEYVEEEGARSLRRAVSSQLIDML